MSKEPPSFTPYGDAHFVGGAEQSFVVIDPKRPLVAITAKHRAKYGPVYVINPFGVLTDEPGFDAAKATP